jgi:hypothetical protein
LIVDNHKAGVAAPLVLGVSTIQRMEKPGVEGSTVANMAKVQAALEAAGIVFIAENGGGPGVRPKGAR